MAKTNAKGDWLNSRGKATPAEYVKPEDKRRDKTVEQICTAAAKLEKKMKKEKQRYVGWIEKYMQYLEKKMKAERSGKGNLILTNYSGNKQVEIKINDVIIFDEKLQLTKSIIDKCIKKWSADANQNIKVLVDHAFEVDKSGNVNKHNILNLTSLNIKDDDWKHAMTILRESITVLGTKQYFTIKYRDSKNEKWETVNLNFSSI